MTTGLGLKHLYTGLRNNSQPSSHWLLFNVPIHNPLRLVFIFLRQAVLALLLTPFSPLSLLFPLLKTRSVPHLTHDLPLKLPHLSQVFLQQLANLHVMQAGWVWDGGETVNVCIHGQSLKGVQVKGESGWVGRFSAYST